MGEFKYRADIDGLRAVAVLAVILFHAGVPFMTGGFVGVDVFFVISGYLITALVLKDLNAGTFTLANFWERRFRRILPALAAVVFTVVIAGWFMLLPDDYDELGRQVATQSIFGQNVLLYKESGYFDTESYRKPLLHTWSLAVEEQFYLLFPLAALWVWKKRPQAFGKFLVGTTIVSFVLCVLVYRNNPELTFYMLPFRAWELSLGALIAWRALTPRPIKPVIREWAALIGLTAILLTVLFYDEKTPFPGIGALLPCLGAAAFIWAGTNGTTMAGRALSLKPIVFIGLISYSWYLWHWPIIVLAKYIPLYKFDGWIAALCVAGSFVLAVLSWKFIETPFRRKILLADQRKLFRGAFVTLILFAAMGLFICTTVGAPFRLSEPVVRYAHGLDDRNPMRKRCDKPHLDEVARDNICQTNSGKAEPSFLLWGDSHADAISPAFYELSKKYDRNGYVATHHGCAPILGYKSLDWNAKYTCYPFNFAMMDFIKRNNVKTVFLAANWDAWFTHADARNLIFDKKKSAPESLQATINSLRNLNVTVYLVANVPFATFDPPRILALEQLYEKKLAPPLMHRSNFVDARKAGIGPFLKTGKGFTALDPIDLMCPGQLCIVEKDGYPLYSDSEHLTVKGAQNLEPMLAPYFKRGF